MNEESKLIELFKKYPEYNQELKHYGKMKLKITTLVIVEEGQVQDIYHSLEDNQDKAYQEIIDQVNAEYGDGGVLQFYSLQGIKEYFEIVHLECQEISFNRGGTVIQKQGIPEL